MGTGVGECQPGRSSWKDWLASDDFGTGTFWLEAGDVMHRISLSAMVAREGM